jgi:predicted secreted hydrolase
MSINHSPSTKTKKKNTSLEAEAIVPQDDAFHGVKSVADVEWWYFDAIFENGYSVHIGVRIFHSEGRSGIVRARFEIYKDGLVDASAVKTALLKDLRISQAIPFIQFDDYNVIKFDEDHYNKTGEWTYTVSFQMEQHAVDLTFTRTMEGWKIETPRNSWAVPLPKAMVDGTIRIHETVIPVHGIGYHDHNWDYSLLTTWMRNTGWYWGRIIGNAGSVIWAQTIEKKEKKNTIVIINPEKGHLKGGKEFITIPPSNVSFSVSHLVRDHQEWIPMEFSIDVSSTPGSISYPVELHLTLSADEIHHTRILAVHYWRYHVKTNGTFSLGPLTETFHDKMQIIELVSFKTLKETE